MRLKMCVACRPPASMPASPCSYVAAECPSDTMCPASVSDRTSSMPPSISGAIVMIPTSGRACAISSRISSARKRDVARDARKLLRGGPAKARHRLRAAEVRVDEVALEMRGQDGCVTGDRIEPRGADAVQQTSQRCRRTRHRRRAEAGDAVLRQLRRQRRGGVGSGERVAAFHAVHVHVDEAGDDDAAGEIVPLAAGRLRHGLGPDVGNQAVVIDHQRAAFNRRVRQHEARAGKNRRHRSTQEGSATSFRPSSGSGVRWPES